MEHIEWLDSLPGYIREAMAVAEDTLTDFAGNVKMSEALARIAFRRAVDGVVSPDPSSLDAVYPPDDMDNVITDQDVDSRISLAIRANKENAHLKKLRLEMLERYEDMVELPKPAAIRYNVVETSVIEQIRRYKAVGFHKQAQQLMVEHGVVYDEELEDYAYADEYVVEEDYE